MFSYGQAEIDAIAKVINTKKLFRYQGEGIDTECFKFENEFSQYLNIPHSLLLSSGTNALVVALFVNGIGPGDEVLIPSYTFFATIAAVLELGAIPVIVNINESLTIDLAEAALKITAKTKALIAVHMDGEPCDMDIICQFSQIHNLILIEDVAQAVGGNFKGKKLGTFGDAGCFSFNVDKIISCGEGGAVVLRDQEKYQKALMYHDTCNQFGPTLKDLYTIEHFSGKSMRASEIQGAMIRVQLVKMEEILHALRMRRKSLEKKLITLGCDLLTSCDDIGACSTTIRIKFKSPSIVKDNVISFNSIGFKTMPIAMRPGHNIWSWFKVLKNHSINQRSNFLQTIDIISSVLIIFISLEETDKEWNSMIEKLELKLLPV